MSNTLAQAHDPLQPSDRRLHSRQPIRSLAYVALDEGNGGIVLNISEGGFSVQAVTSLMDDLLPGVRFQLSESEGWVEANARITWTGQSRKVAGLEFVDLPEDTRNRIREWLVRETQPVGSPGDASAVVEDIVAPAPEIGNCESGILTAPIVAPEVSVEDQREELHEGPRRDAKPAVASESVTPTVPSVVVLSAPAPDVFTPTADEGRESQPAPTPRKAEAKLHFVARLFHNKWALAGLVALLAVGSLAAGWMAGQGAFGKVLQRAQSLAPQGGAALRDLVSNSANHAAKINEIEIVNANSQRWTIPFNGPLNDPEDGARRQASGNTSYQPRKAPTGFRMWIPTPPRQVRAATDSGEALKENPPAVPNGSGASDNVFSSGSNSSQTLAVRPALRVPEPPPATGIVKQGHVIRRVIPVYPTLARNPLVEGTVRLNVTVGEDGTVRGVALLGGPSLLVDAAENAVRQWRYAPATVDGRPIEFQQEVDLSFHLSETSH
jgi:TonB family protein